MRPALDVLVVGAGPGGLATAIKLKRLAKSVFSLFFPSSFSSSSLSFFFIFFLPLPSFSFSSSPFVFLSSTFLLFFPSILLFFLFLNFFPSVSIFQLIFFFYFSVLSNLFSYNFLPLPFIPFSLVPLLTCLPLSLTSFLSLSFLLSLPLFPLSTKTYLH